MKFLRFSPLFLLLLIACGPMSKEQFLANQNRFIQSVKEDHNTFSAEDWERHNERLNRMLEEEYPEVEEDMTGEEKAEVWANVLAYHMYQYSGRAAEHWEANEERYVELLDAHTEWIEENGDIFLDEVLPELERLGPEIERLGEQFLDKLEDKGTLDRLERSLDRFEKRLEERLEKN